MRGIRTGEASHPGPRRPRGSGSSDASMSQRSRFAPLSRDDSDTEEQEDNPADDDLLDALELDLAGEALTLVDTVDPTVNDDIVQDGSGSDGDAETVISEGPDPGAQADRSSEPEMAVSQVVPEVRPSARTQAGFAALDLINVRDIFTQRACVMEVPPAFLRGAYHSAMRTALLDITTGMELSNNTRVVRGWKLFVLLPGVARCPRTFSWTVDTIDRRCMSVRKRTRHEETRRARQLYNSNRRTKTGRGNTPTRLGISLAATDETTCNQELSGTQHAIQRYEYKYQILTYQYLPKASPALTTP